MSEVGKINITITADSKDFERSMDKVQKETKNTESELKNSLKSFGAWSAGIAAAAATAAAAITASSMKSIRELKNQAQAANTSVASFQQQAYAAEQAGISQEKYADILKDVNDRVGDFLTTGGGPMADFFDQVAPKIGITADAFRNLSGPDALQLFVKSLEDANLNQQEMTFYMEAMASDSTRLLPLLRNNGKAMREQANAAKELGIGLSEIEVENVERAQKAIDSITSTMQSETLNVVADLAPAIEMVAKSMSDATKGAEGFDVALDAVLPVAKAVAKVVAGIAIGAKTIQLGFTGFGALLGIIITEVGKLGKAIYDGAVKPIKIFMEAANELPGLAGTFDGALSAIDKFSKNMGEGIAGASDITQGLIGDVEELKAELVEMTTGDMGFEAIDAYFAKLQEKIIEGRNQVKQATADAVTGEEESDGPLKLTDPFAGIFGGNKDQGMDAGQPDSGLGKFDQEAFLEETELMKELYNQRYMSLEELDYMHLQRMNEQNEKAYDDGLISWQDYFDNKEKIAQISAEAERAIATSAFESILGTLAQGSKKALEIQKGYGIAKAGVSIAEGIAQANSLPFPLNLAEMARVIKVGSDVFGSIKSAQAGAASIPGGGGASAGAASAPPPPQQQGPQQVFNVDFVGESNATAEQTRGLLEFINEAASDNVQINVSGG